VLSSRSGAIHSLTGCNFSCKQQQEATDAAIQGARENAAIRQAQLVRGHNQRIFDSFKRPAEGVFDALLTKPQSIWPAIGNSLKTALLTAIKDVVTSRAAVMLMQLFTGTRVSLAGGGTPLFPAAHGHWPTSRADTGGRQPAYSMPPPRPKG
jgi:hypothetical protein